MFQRDRIRSVALACLLAGAWSSAFAPRAVAQPATTPPPPPQPPPASDVCPAIEEDGLLCSADLLSGNCADFVAAAERLAGLYRAELAQLPGSEGSLLTTIWWGCGPGNLSDIAALLARIESPRAQALLKQPPYATLLAQQAPPPPPPAGAPPPPPPPDCDELASPAARNACIGTRLQQARAENQATFARCQPLVPAGLRDDFADSQSTFRSLLPIRCNAQASGSEDKNLATFLRSRCMVDALNENTRGMLAAHPECKAAD